MREKTTVLHRMFDRDNPGLLIVWMRPQEALKLHTHEFHELVVVTKGEGEHLAGKDRYRISTGDVFLIRPGMSHGYDNTRGLEIVNVLFYPSILKLPDFDLGSQPGFVAFFEIEPRLRASHGFEGRLRLAFEDLMEAERLVGAIDRELAGRGPAHYYMAVSHFMLLRGFLSRSYSQQRSGTSPKILKFGELLSHIDKNFASNLQLPDLADRAGMSLSSLNRVFRRALGCSPMEHIIRKRVGHAGLMMTEKGMNVSEAAAEAGFHDSNYFSRQFKKVTGLTPSQYRRGGAGGT